MLPTSRTFKTRPEFNVAATGSNSSIVVLSLSVVVVVQIVRQVQFHNFVRLQSYCTWFCWTGLNFMIYILQKKSTGVYIYQILIGTQIRVVVIVNVTPCKLGRSAKWRRKRWKIQPCKSIGKWPTFGWGPCSRPPEPDSNLPWHLSEYSTTTWV